MQDFRRRKIRILFYTFGILTIILLSALIGIPHFIQLKRGQNENIEQFSRSIMLEKRRMLSDIINGFFSEIDFINKDTHKKYGELSVELCTMLSGYLSRSGNKDANPYARVDSIISKSAGGLFSRVFCVLIMDNNKENPLYISPLTKKLVGTSLPDLTDKNLYPIVSQCQVEKNITIYVFMTAHQMYSIIEDRARGALKAFRYSNGGYIWVNKVINYNGGDAYASRIIHPNLPQTEGMMLSTSMKDIHGNLPYLVELEGVKRDGELYFEYYFKEEDSEKISRKLTFAKLYKPYDWIVATGIYMDDVEALINKETAVMSKNYDQQIRNFSFLLMIIVIYLIFLLSFLENRVCVFVEEFINRIRKSENELIKEKNNLLIALTKLKNIAYRDHLTGLLNRRLMFDAINNEYDLCLEEDLSFALIMCDVDDFKRINDQYGHSSGDIVLREIAELMRSSIKPNDMISRWGGEEFLILGKSYSLQDGVSLSEKVRNAIENHKIQVKDVFLSVTMTFGVVAFDRNKSVDQLISDADSLLYEGKRGGKNCVCGIVEHK